MDNSIIKFDINKVQTPYFVTSHNLLVENLKILKSVKEATDCKVLLAQKAFSMYHFYPLIAEYVDGCTASGLYEAKLGHEEMKKENHVFSPAYTDKDIDELVDICEHMVFNSFSQLNRYKDKALSNGVSVGIRVNPEFSTQIGHEIYDPCSKGSRLGVRLANFEEESLEGVDGLHFHTLCQQNSDDLASTLKAVEEKFSKYLHSMKWLNFGGGHHITRKDYDVKLLIDEINRIKAKYNLQVYIEPGEAFALDAGFLVSTVVDIIKNDVDIAIMDVSAACHMPDVLEMPYRPMIIGSGEATKKQYTYRLGGPTCLAGDVISEYSFDKPLEIGDRLIFTDMAIYSMVKTNTFNGMPLPTICATDKDDNIKIIKEFSYSDFKSRL